MRIPNRKTLDDGLKVLLEEGTGRAVDIACAPTDENGNQARYPYLVIYPIPGGWLSGPPFCGATEDADFHYQITVFGERADSVQFVADLARWALLGRDQFDEYDYQLNYSDGAVQLRQLVGPTGRLVREGQVYRSDEDYSIRVTSRV